MALAFSLNKRQKQGFTLIELSIVLVIIGLIVGGVLVGSDLISSAAIRAQIAQIEQFTTAANAFKIKYNYLPGDIPGASAVAYGFKTRGPDPYNLLGEGDGNGVIQASCLQNGLGCPYISGTSYYKLGTTQQVGWASETVLFWADLSMAGLIAGSFTNPTTATDTTETSSPALQNYFPRGKISGNYVYVWSGGQEAAFWATPKSNGKNYFALSGISKIQQSFSSLYSYSGITPTQAYAIDTKIDYGLAQAGKVMALFPNLVWNVAWANGTAISVGGYLFQSGMGANAGSPTYGTTTNATPYDPASCYDNNNVAGDQKYQLLNANALNCSLSFQF